MFKYSIEKQEKKLNFFLNIRDNISTKYILREVVYEIFYRYG